MLTRQMLRTRVLPALMAIGFLTAAGAAELYPPALWSGHRYWMIGPYRGGRVTTVTYSKPELQTHITYPNSTATGTDQKLNKILGPGK